MRHQYNKIIQTEIRQLQKFKEYAEKRNVPENIARFEKRLKELAEELEVDTPRYLQYVQEQEEMIRLQAKKQLGKDAKQQADTENKEKLEVFYRQENQIRRNDRIMQHFMKKEWEWLCKQDERLPSYIRNNLLRMPNNKGYIFKNIWYFGHMKAESKDLLIMFERSPGGDKQLIHEIHKGRYHKVFQKNNGGPNTLLSEKMLRP